MLLASMMLLFSACGSSVTIQNVDFAQPLEEQLQPNVQGEVVGERSGISFSVLPMLENEGLSLDEFGGTPVNIIQNHQGFYFVTAAGFRNVYVMETNENELKSTAIIEIGEERLENPALNQRNPFIQLVDGEMAVNLTKEGRES
ncbi:MAG: hypothetical protein ACOC2C_00985 [Cyclonatronaceae bacterium]